MFAKKTFSPKMLFMLKQLGGNTTYIYHWKRKFGIQTQPTKLTYTRPFFGWFSLVDFWFGFVGLVFLTHKAILGGNLTHTKPRNLKFGMAAQLTKKDNPKGLGLG